jgi:hypothetical protein
VREDLVHWDARNLPAWATEDPVRYFSAAETHERANGVAYEEWKFSLPRELSRDQQFAAARDFLQASFGTRHPYIWALHDPPAADGGSQPHVHVLWSARTLDAYERTPATFFKRYNRAHPERGGAEKSREFSHFGAVKASRTLYCDVMNMRLEQHLEEARLHPDRLTARGFDREPEPRARPSDSNAAKYKHEMTDTWHKVLDHRAQRGQYEGAELADAQRYWEARKQELGITWTMPLAQQLEGIRAARAQAVTHARERVSARELGARAQALGAWPYPWPHGPAPPEHAQRGVRALRRGTPGEAAPDEVPGVSRPPRRCSPRGPPGRETGATACMQDGPPQARAARCASTAPSCAA